MYRDGYEPCCSPRARAVPRVIFVRTNTNQIRHVPRADLLRYAVDVDAVRVWGRTCRAAGCWEGGFVEPCLWWGGSSCCVGEIHRLFALLTCSSCACMTVIMKERSRTCLGYSTVDERPPLLDWWARTLFSSMLVLINENWGWNLRSIHCECG